MSVEKAGSKDVTQSKKSGLTLYYYLNVKRVLLFRAFILTFNSAFQAQYGNLVEELKACREDSMPKLCRHPKNDCLCLETKRFAT